MKADIVIVGTGDFAARQLFDIAATSSEPVRVVIVGRNLERLSWLRTAARARASIFGRPASFDTLALGLDNVDEIASALASLAPKVVVQTASMQGSSVIGSADNAWARLVAEGGYGATAVFHALLSSRVATAVTASGIDAAFINSCYPDVVNALLAARNLPILCGVGNIGILSSCFAGEVLAGDESRLKLLAHYSTIGTWRLPPASREGPFPRVWIDDAEINDVNGRFAGVQLTSKPVIDISGATGVPLMLAIAAQREWLGHVPGPEGRVGGYPVAVADGKLRLRLPPAVTELEAVAFNEVYERQNGVSVDDAGNVHYAGRLADAFARVSPSIAGGFHVDNLEEAYAATAELSRRLSDPAAG